MRFELKKFKAHKELSEETLCFDADLWADGEKVAFVANHGTGGCHAVRWADQTKGKEIEALCDQQPDERTNSFGHELVSKFDIDILIDKLLDKREEMKWLKNQCKKNVLFRLKGDKEDSWRTFKGVAWGPAVEQQIAKYGDQVERIANLENHDAVIELN